MSCLTAAKRAAVACAVIIALVQTAQAATSCTVAAGHLVTRIKRNWPSNGDAPLDMVGTVLNKSPAGVRTGKTRFKLKAYSNEAFIKEAKQLRPPLSPSPELLKAFIGNDEAVTVSNLPGSDLFAANTVSGTLHCNSTVFFAARAGQASLAPAPESWENDMGGSCGKTRSFASVDGLSVVIDDDLNAGPSLASTLVLTPWSAGKWQEPCTASFVFIPASIRRRRSTIGPASTNGSRIIAAAPAVADFSASRSISSGRRRKTAPAWKRSCSRR